MGKEEMMKCGFESSIVAVLTNSPDGGTVIFTIPRIWSFEK
jgi:hypothetical protein